MDRQELSESLREQARWCGKLGSPFYARLLARMIEDVDSSGPCWRALEPHSADSRRSLVPLRFLGGLHRLILEGRIPSLARHYPSVGGDGDPEAAWEALRDELESRGTELTANLPKTVQTNEVSRCCALLPGFLQIAESTGLPLRLLEIGCSAGLNLRWDQYRYQTMQGAWGPAASRVVFDDPYLGDPPGFPKGLDRSVAVIERLGCDLNPVDPTTEEGRLTLLSFVWPDQEHRFRNLANALEIAREVPAVIERSSALDWLAARLRNPPHGAATVVFHSIVVLYFSNPERSRMVELLAEAGARATDESPLAWLGMEPGGNETEVHLTIWPGGERKRIATAGHHGRGVKILAGSAP